MATISSGSERMIRHTGTETRPRLLRVGSSRESFAMDESLTVRRRVEDDGPRVVNSCHEGVRHQVVTDLMFDSTSRGRDG